MDLVPHDRVLFYQVRDINSLHNGTSTHDYHDSACMHMCTCGSRFCKPRARHMVHDSQGANIAVTISICVLRVLHTNACHMHVVLPLGTGPNADTSANLKQLKHAQPCSERRSCRHKSLLSCACILPVI